MINLEIAINLFLNSIGIFSLALYFISVFFSRIMFDMLGVKISLAFIPFYNTYKIYKEYKGRVWKKNWGIAYLLIFIVPNFFYTLWVIVWILLASISNGNMFNVLAGGLSFYIILGLILSILNFILNAVLYLPIFETMEQKIILILNMVFNLLLIFGNFFGNSFYIEAVRIIALFLIILFIRTFFRAGSIMRDKVKRGEYVLYEKLDYNVLSSDEIKDILKQRGRVLAIPNEKYKVKEEVR